MIMNPFDKTQQITVQKIRRQLYLNTNLNEQGLDQAQNEAEYANNPSKFTIYNYDIYTSDGPIDKKSQADPESYQTGSGRFQILDPRYSKCTTKNSEESQSFFVK